MRISDWSSDVCSSDLAAASAKSASVLRCSESQFQKSSRGKSTAKNLRLPCERRGYHAHERPTASRKQQTPSGNPRRNWRDPRRTSSRRYRIPRTTRKRSEELRVGKECVSTCKSRGSP